MNDNKETLTIPNNSLISTNNNTLGCLGHYKTTDLRNRFYTSSLFVIYKIIELVFLCWPRGKRVKHQEHTQRIFNSSKVGNTIITKT